MTVVASLISAAESVAKSRDTAKAKAAQTYRDILTRDASGQSHKDDAKALAECLDVLELSPADAQADAAALAEHAGHKAKLLQAGQREDLVEAIRVAHEQIKAEEQRHRTEMTKLNSVSNSVSAKYRIATDAHDQAGTAMKELCRKHPRVFDAPAVLSPIAEVMPTYLGGGMPVVSEHKPPVLHDPRPVFVGVGSGSR